MWTDRPCKNFHLLVCLAILDGEKSTLMENKFGITEILKVRHTYSDFTKFSEAINICCSYFKVPTEKFYHRETL